ncbi:MAG: signal peptidase I [Burkholderiales bacterium]|nr:signal peptidase I [Phycisphaerae bacterium]
MISLGVFITIFAISLFSTAWALSLSARAVGSPRGRFRVALIVAALLIVLGIVFAVMEAAMTPTVPPQVPVTGLVLLIVQVIAIFFILRSTFDLTVKRTFAPFGTYVALILVQLVLTVFVIKPFIVEAFVMPTKSMSPTIEPGDRFVVNKLIRPRRLDLVAYWNDDAEPAIYCKRLIGLPGERLRFEQGGLYVNDQPIALPPVLAGRCSASVSTLPFNRSRYRDGESIRLGEDEYFFIGDNVEASADSRLAGPSRASSVVGVVDFLYWPLSKARLVR